jgi:hypothetical protein
MSNRESEAAKRKHLSCFANAGRREDCFGLVLHVHPGISNVGA